MRRLALLAVQLALAMGAHAAGIVECPIDGKPFRYEEPPTDPIRGRYLDMKPVASYPAPWPLPQCPDNGFVVYKKGSFTPGELAKLRPFVASPRYREMLKTDTNYYLAATLRREAGDALYDVAWALTQATWEAGADPSRYRRYAEEALAAYNALPAGIDRRQNTLREMISGELERRLGLFDIAEKRFRRLRDAAEFTAPQLQRAIELELRLIDRKDTSAHRMP
jgi:hypothetical protein